MRENLKTDVGPLFLANFVHQIVNPLNGVIGTLDNIYDGTYSSEDARQKINASRAQLEQCVTLIRNLAYLSDYFFETKDEKSLKPVRQNAVSVLPQVIIESLQFFQVAASQSDIRMELSDSQTQYRVKVRPELLKQVFINIFDNWTKYGIEESVVKIVPVVNRNKDLVVEIVGKSIGFNNAEANNLFELGYRSTTAKDTVAQGSGIGLHVCKSIMEIELEGRISAVHNSSRGETTFRLAIPEGKWEI